MTFMKTADEEVALNTLAKHAKLVISVYTQNRHKKHWGVLEAYALYCLTEGKMMVMNEVKSAIADLEAFENWQTNESKLSYGQQQVLQRFPSILLLVLQQESRTGLRADLPKVFHGYTEEQCHMLKRLLSGAFAVLNNGSTIRTTEKDEFMRAVVRELVQELRPKASHLVMKRMHKHAKVCMDVLESATKAFEEDEKAPDTPRAREAAQQQEQDQVTNKQVEKQEQDKVDELKTNTSPNEPVVREAPSASAADSDSDSESESDTESESESDTGSDDDHKNRKHDNKKSEKKKKKHEDERKPKTSNTKKSHHKRHNRHD